MALNDSGTVWDKIHMPQDGDGEVSVNRGSEGRLVTPQGGVHCEVHLRRPCKLHAGFEDAC